jgi:hypothetical protein
MSLRLLLAFTFLPFLSFAQKDTAIKFTEVVNVDATKEQLFLRARAWFNDAFKSSKDVLQIQDKGTGEIAGNGSIAAVMTYKMMGKRTKPG